MDLSCSETKCSSIWVRNNPPLRKMENQRLKLGITKSKDQVPNSLLLNPVSSKSPSYLKGICQRIGYLLWFSYMKCLKLTKKKKQINNPINFTDLFSRLTATVSFQPKAYYPQFWVFGF